MAIGIIGGSGFYKLGEGESKRHDTPFGMSGEIVEIKEPEFKKPVYFLARHGRDHSVPPHAINYRANIYALHALGVKYVVATNAVGSTQNHIKPGMFGIPDQIIDFTSGRKNTFFTGTADPTVPIDYQRVVHTDVSEPFSLKVRECIRQTLEEMEEVFVGHGTIAVANGPRFETPAEVKMLRMLGADFLGMTSSPEAFLAKELGIEYATIAVVTNYGAGMQHSVTHEEVVEMFQEKIRTLQEVVNQTIFKVIEQDSY